MLDKVLLQLSIIVVTVAVSVAQNARIEGVVKSPGGSGNVSNAFVVIHDFERDYHLSTNWERAREDGTFFFVVKAGCYDLFVSSPWTKPCSKRICVNDGEVKRITVKAKPAENPRIRQE